jgi:hypothetical protein
MGDSARSDRWIALGLDPRGTFRPRDPVPDALSASERSILINEHFSKTNHRKNE